MQELLFLLGASTKEGGLPPFVSAVKSEEEAESAAEKEPPMRAAVSALNPLLPTTHWHHTTFELLLQPPPPSCRERLVEQQPPPLTTSMATFTTVEAATGEMDVFNECFERDASLSSKVRRQTEKEILDGGTLYILYYVQCALVQ